MVTYANIFLLCGVSAHGGPSLCFSHGGLMPTQVKAGSKSLPSVGGCLLYNEGSLLFLNALSCVSFPIFLQLIRSIIMPSQKPDIEATDPALSSSGSSKTDLDTTRHMENAHRGSVASGTRKASVAAKLRNPLAGFSEEQVLADVETWCTEKGLMQDLDSFRKGALVARMGQRDDGYEYVSILSEEEKDWLRHESTHRWSQPFMLYFLVVLCAGSAIVQGMDQTAVNGAQVCYLTVPNSFQQRPSNKHSSSTSVSLVLRMSGYKVC
jgi:hypothetical protein